MLCFCFISYFLYIAMFVEQNALYSHSMRFWFFVPIYFCFLYVVTVLVTLIQIVVFKGTIFRAVGE